MAKFSIPLDQLAARAQGRIDEVVRKITFDLFTAVVLKSPVDTGRFRANWTVNLNAPSHATSQSTDASESAAEVEKALSYAAGGIVVLANALPYAYRLEYEGWSKQAPLGMVRTSASEFADHITAALKS